MKITNYENAQWRNDRLYQVAGYLGCELRKSLYSLHDHKGTLTAVFSNYYEKRDMDKIASKVHKAWIDSGEDDYEVIFVIGTDDIIRYPVNYPCTNIEPYEVMAYFYNEVQE